MEQSPRRAESLRLRRLLRGPVPLEHGAIFSCLLERWLLWVHWGSVPLCLLLIPLFPGVSTALVLALILGLAAGNVILTWLASDVRPPLRLVRGLSSGFEWLLALAIVFLFCRDGASTVIAFGILTTLVLLTAARYRLPGLVGAELAAGVVGFGMYALQASTAGAPPTTGLPLVRWEIILLPLGLVAGAVVHANDEAFRQGEAERAQAALALQQLRAHLSPRELELLPLLAAGLSNEEIARHLSVSLGTVKVHVRNIGEKLGVPGRRSAIVAAAQTLQILADAHIEADC